MKHRGFTTPALSGGTRTAKRDTQRCAERKAVSNATQAAATSDLGSAYSLINGPIPAADMEQLAEEEEISFKTFKRAKEVLGVISYQRGRLWYWDLPIEVAYEDCTSSEGQNSSEGQVTALVPLSQI